LKRKIGEKKKTPDFNIPVLLWNFAILAWGMMEFILGSRIWYY
jgi:hypothetical protein